MEAMITAEELASVIDHTLLRPEATPAQIDRLCREARENAFHAVCVNAVYVPRAVLELADSGVVVAAVVGFPLGADSTAAKVRGAERAIACGAQEIDMVLHIGALIAGEKNLVRDDIYAVAEVVHGASSNYSLKVILETAVLNPDHLALGCRCCAEAEADFLKTSTGFHPAGGASVAAVRALKRLAPPMKVKAAGGIRDLQTAVAMIDAGADRLGMSASVSVLKELTGGL